MFPTPIPPADDFRADWSAEMRFSVLGITKTDDHLHGDDARLRGFTFQQIATVTLAFDLNLGGRAHNIAADYQLREMVWRFQQWVEASRKGVLASSSGVLLLPDGYARIVQVYEMDNVRFWYRYYRPESPDNQIGSGTTNG